MNVTQTLAGVCCNDAYCSALIQKNEEFVHEYIQVSKEYNLKKNS